MKDNLFEAKGLTKSFPGVNALTNVDITISAGEVVGLVGENGAGKSTLLNIMSGLYKQDSGQMFLYGKDFAPKDYHSATMQGVSRVFQELALVPNLSVYENIFLSHENLFSTFGVLNKRKMIVKANEILSHLHLEIDPTKPVEEYPFSIKQAIEIAKACSLSSELFGIDVPLILLDEPTSSLTQDEIKEFYSLLQKMKSKASFVLISHRLSEILQMSDRIYVMKDGQIVDNVNPDEIEEKKLHELMVGRKRDEDYYQEHDQLFDFDTTVLSVKNFTRRNEFENINFEVRAGEIVGIGGVIGSGKAELGKALFGCVRVDHGSMTLSGLDVTNQSIGKMISMGIGYIPEERTTEAIIGGFSVNWNISLASLWDLVGNRMGLLQLKKEKENAKEYIQRFSIKAQDETTECGTLSGGNQQKVVLAKWLMRSLKVIILDNPTRGIDPGVKEEIYKLFRQLAKQGLAIVIITDELLELIGVSNRILVMKDGKLTSEIDGSFGNKPTEKELVSYMV